MNKKPVYVVFVNKKLEKNFEKLNKGKFQDKNLYKFINRAIDDLKQNPTYGIKIPKKIWAKDYVQKYEVTNLWKS
jgi:methionine synthase II (cobalamin-independent)